ncbi:class I SAM-dependent methyltransferase [Pseudoroseicyclus aestuarii]|uniref:Methyltransferase family protein n=1 Tax=Pseudoroseicyclus aestuarii TaxID=1795041 RepID=A0A318SN06_9RHOB|nr:class I SAM-dependent methyltransferase [Pseudoroseicyclus aestuarii]PYE81343.1 methyltransferase family protein [Pseudoroseicyclus aestuarii]
MPTTDASLSPQELLRRWDAQQTAFIKHRDQRFDIMTDLIAGTAGEAPRVLDLACGPGSLSAAILQHLPKAQITAVDKDPVLLEIARGVFAGDARVEVREADLDDAQALAALGDFDAVVSSTALHWLSPQALSALYFRLPNLLREGGIFMNADHLYFDAQTQPLLDRLAKADDAANQEAAFGSGTDTWDAWFALAEAQPWLSAAAEARARVWEGKAPPAKVTLGYHIEALRSAGLREAGTVWQYLDDYVVFARR